MPAVQLSKLATQIELLFRLWEKPAEFTRALADLLDLYADHVYVPAQQTRTIATLPAYRVPPIVIVRLEQAFYPAAHQNPQKAIELADMLWVNGHKEMLHFSAFLLGSLPSEFQAAVVQRMVRWAEKDLPSAAFADLFKQASRNLRKKTPQAWLETIDNWLRGDQPGLHEKAFQALLPLIEDPEFENLPAVYRLLSPLVQNPPESLFPELIDLLAALAKRSAAETAYFFRQSITSTSSPASLRLLRRALPALPESVQISLGPKLRDPESKTG